MANLSGAAINIILYPIASGELPNDAYLFAIFILWGLVSLVIHKLFLVETKDKTR
jgi:hypothetical protein